MRETHFPRSTVTVVCLVALIVAAFAGQAFAIDDIVRTIFVIGNVDSTIMDTYPIVAFSVNGNQLVRADTFYPQHHGVGPVGLAVDPIAEHLYCTYEGEGFLEAFDARDATPLTTINLTGTDNLAGIDVRVGEGLLYVINRRMSTLYVFDSDTFQPVEDWPLENLGVTGAYDLEIVEHWDGLDVIFVSNGTPDVNYYNLDTHEHLGSFTMSNIASSMTVDNHRGKPVIFAASTGNGTPGGHNFLLKYDMASDTQDQVSLGGGDGRGVSVNPGENLVYVNVSTSFNGTIRVFDQDSLTQLNSYSVVNGFFTSPSDNEASNLAFGSTVKKEIINASANPINGANEFDAGEQIEFRISLTNNRDVDIHVLPITDIYDTTQLDFFSSTVTPVDAVDDGEIDWADMIPVIGHDLVFEEVFTFEATFTANPDDCQRFVNGSNIAQSHDAVDARGEDVEESSGTADYKIWCTCVTDEDCDDGIYCNGPETCENRQCIHGGNPCPVDDGEFCNGQETLECIEETQECGHTGDPCTDDGNMCNGDEVCDQDLQQCVNTGDPCEDDGVFCNGDEFCSPNKLECQHTGDPCEEDETCDEEADLCVGGDNPIDDGEEDAGWPEGKVTGGCCGCE